ncbi:MAG: hypothetical protein GYB31_07335 [Bacteroidetes bacterium]|nr:hypothetical protein [Bacteroidota bacterium]
MSEKKWTRKRILQTSFLFMILVIFPLISWYYLRGGLDYRLDALDELEELGTLAAFEWTDQENETFNKEMASGNLLIAGFLPSGELREVYVDNMKKFHEQFDNRTDVYFLTLVPSGNAAQLVSDYEIKDQNQWKWVNIPESQLAAIAATYQLNPEQDPAEWISLVDEKGQIRKHYRIDDKKQLSRLVEHMAILLPRSVPRKKQE